jgi:hypothetical protein
MSGLLPGAQFADGRLATIARSNVSHDLGYHGVSARHRQDETESLDTTVADRRRSGRVEYKNRHLIALLRGCYRTDLAQEDTDNTRGDDPLAPVRGIIVGLLLSAIIWGVLATLLWNFALR